MYTIITSVDRTVFSHVSIFIWLCIDVRHRHITVYGRLYVIGQTIIFLPCDFYLLSFFLSFFLRLISAAVDWMSTILPHMVLP